MKKTQMIRIALWALGGMAAVWIGIRFLLPLLLPFIVGFLTAGLTRRPARLLRERGRLPGWLASGSAVLGLYALLGLAVYWLCRIICGELARFTQELPLLLQSMAAPLDRLRKWLDELAGRAPELLRVTLREGLESLFSGGRVVAERGYAWLFSLASSAIAALPDMALFLVTMILSGIMFSVQYDDLSAALRRQLPELWLNRLEATVRSLRRTMSAWFRAELKLVGVTFALVTLGLLLLGVDFPLLFGGITALVDALPVFGAGTVLVPWGAMSFLRGDSRTGAGLLLLYAAAYLTRTTLEPRLLGRQVGLNPLLTLLAIYAGFRIFGVVGMLIFPIAAALLKQLWSHAASGWQRPENNP